MNPNKKNTVGSVLESHADREKTNRAGGVSYKADQKTRLYLMSATWLVGEPKFYSPDGDDAKITKLIRKVADKDPMFVLKLAHYLRNKLYLRTAPQVLLVETALSNAETKILKQGEIKRACSHIIRRPDEMATVIAYLKSRIGDLGDRKDSGSVPSSLKKGLAKVFGTFSEYQLQKYNTANRDVSLRDVMLLTHPKPDTEEKSKLYKRLLDGNMKTPDTWETIVSGQGSSKESWAKAAKVMPYMAMMRNLRNLMKYDVGIDEAVEKLTNPELVAKSRQFPYRFFTAYKTIMAAEEDPGYNKKRVLRALEKAMRLSVKNMPHMDGVLVVAADHSGSMTYPVSSKSVVTRREVGDMFLAMSDSIADKGVAMAFGQSLVELSLPSEDILNNVEKLGRVDVGHATFAYLVFEKLMQEKRKVDRIVIYTDMQIWDSAGYYGQDSGRAFQEHFYQYKRTINPNVKVVLVDLAGYGTVALPPNEPNVFMVGGFSDKIFDLIKVMEEDHTKAVANIEALTI